MTAPANGHDLGVVHTHQAKLRPLAYDRERAKSRGQRRLGWFALGIVVAAVLWLVVQAAR